MTTFAILLIIINVITLLVGHGNAQLTVNTPYVVFLALSTFDPHLFTGLALLSVN